MGEPLPSLATRQVATVIEGLRVNSYNLPLRDTDGFVGARARSKAGGCPSRVLKKSVACRGLA